MHPGPFSGLSAFNTASFLQFWRGCELCASRTLRGRNRRAALTCSRPILQMSKESLASQRMTFTCLW
ncbi:hypothetical protein BDV96DRAFT_561616 [Lophiotrema nucula]|uniref:Uncharacterized protein n=1 Tax=Lophiotrema nucula TaxID=690887 RepID=A0A6A5ZWZ8_9PLEO|nr:hypothetical protein BDV96DRAFT_561616 [Lophiotrema nucula]